MFEKSNLFWQKHAPVREQSRDFWIHYEAHVICLQGVKTHFRMSHRLPMQWCGEYHMWCSRKWSLLWMLIYNQSQESAFLNLNFKTLVLLKSQINLSQHPESWLSTLRSERILFVCLFYVQLGMCDLSSWTRDWTLSPCIGSSVTNHWTTREVPWRYSLKENI